MIRMFAISLGIAFLFVCCNRSMPKNSNEKVDLKEVVFSSIDSFTMNDFFGVSHLNKVIFKDSLFDSNDSLTCKYCRFYGSVNFNKTKTTLSIDVFFSENKAIIDYININDENASDRKLENRYMPILVNNILYRIELGREFEDIKLYLLNATISLLQSYIYFTRF